MANSEAAWESRLTRMEWAECLSVWVALVRHHVGCLSGLGWWLHTEVVSHVGDTHLDRVGQFSWLFSWVLHLSGSLIAPDTNIQRQLMSLQASTVDTISE